MCLPRQLVQAIPGETAISSGRKKSSDYVTHKTTIYPLRAIRALILHVQGLSGNPSGRATPTKDTINSVIQKIGWVQIDTLQVVSRSQNLVFWSRLGSYDTADLARLLYDRQERRFFEYWLHGACIIPLCEYRYRLPLMRHHRNHAPQSNTQWGHDVDASRLVAEVLTRVRCHGPVRAADFEYKGPRRGSWWEWKPAKRALETLYNQGELMITDRINFQRVYDLRDRVLPEWVDTTEPTEEEATRYLLVCSMRALGVCTPVQVADYAHIKRGTARPTLEELTGDGTFVAVRARLDDDTVDELVVHRDHVSLLGQAADGGLVPDGTTFLSPFDNLFWARGRDQGFWSFRNVLEAYKPEASRVWGYFCLPVLYKDRLVGRFDPKLERRAKVLRLKAIYLESGVDPDEELVAGVAAAMRDFMAFHDARELVIERSQPAELGDRLVKSM